MDHHNSEPLGDAAAAPLRKLHSREFFRQINLHLKIGLLGAFLLPLIALALHFHFYFNRTLTESGKLHLLALAESQRNTIDLFLEERVANIFSLFRSEAFSVTPSKDKMEQYLDSLRQANDAFVDVGFFNASGVQVGYAGPHPYLEGKDYSGELWFRNLMEGERGFHISDVYLGFRKQPHFSIAVWQPMDEGSFVVRATLDPAKFYLFLRSTTQEKGVHSALINREGLYQVVDPERGELFAKTKYPLPSQDEGPVLEALVDGDEVLVAYAWLNETPWALATRQPLAIAYAEMYRARRIMIITTSLILLLTVTAIWMTTSRLLHRAEFIAESRRELQSELLHAAKLASVGELAAGVAHEINNPLAIIGATTGVIRDMMDPELDIDWSLESVTEELDNIDEAVFRARGITSQLMDVSRKNTPRLVPCNVNTIIDDVLGSFLEHELSVSGILLVRHFDNDVPDILLDPDQMSQVFLNLINNAVDAIEDKGSITLATRFDGDHVRVTVTDTGRGMTPGEVDSIFLPFFTTKEVGKGTGLGLSVSLGIVESAGGRIEVQSVPGVASSFTVFLPMTTATPDDDTGPRAGMQDS